MEMTLSRFRAAALRWIIAVERRWIPNERYGALVVQYACKPAVRADLAKHVKLAITLLSYAAPVWYRRVQTEVASVTLIELGPNVGLARFTLATRDVVINATRLRNNPPEWAPIEIAFASFTKPLTVGCAGMASVRRLLRSCCASSASATAPKRV
jgi:hypothetical protein